MLIRFIFRNLYRKRRGHSFSLMFSAPDNSRFDYHMLYHMVTIIYGVGAVFQETGPCPVQLLVNFRLSRFRRRFHRCILHPIISSVIIGNLIQFVQFLGVGDLTLSSAIMKKFLSRVQCKHC